MTANGTNASSYGFAGASNSANVTVTSTGCYTQSGNYAATLSTVQSYTENDYWAGNYANGSYAYSSVVLQNSGRAQWSGSDTGTEVYGSTSSYSQSGRDNANNTQALGGSGINGTYLYAANGSSSWSGSQTAGDTYTLHAEGCFTNGSWALTSMALNAATTLAASDSGSDSAANTRGAHQAGSVRTARRLIWGESASGAAAIVR